MGYLLFSKAKGIKTLLHLLDNVIRPTPPSPT